MTPAQPTNSQQYTLILERLELVHGLVQRFNDLDTSIKLMRQAQDAFIAATSTEFTGMCIRVDKLVTKIEEIETEQVRESKRTDTALARLDELFRTYGVSANDTKESVKRINSRIDQLEISVREMAFIVKIVSAVIVFIATGLGGWFLAQFLGLIH